MKKLDFTIVFQKLDDARSKQERNGPRKQLFSKTSAQEIDEIAELRRIVLEVTESSPASFTST